MLVEQLAVHVKPFSLVYNSIETRIIFIILHLAITADVTWEETMNGVIDFPAAEMHMTAETCFKLLWTS